MKKVFQCSYLFLLTQNFVALSWGLGVGGGHEMIHYSFKILAYCYEKLFSFEVDFVFRQLIYLSLCYVEQFFSINCHIFYHSNPKKEITIVYMYTHCCQYKCNNVYFNNFVMNYNYVSRCKVYNKHILHILLMDSYKV